MRLLTSTFELARTEIVATSADTGRHASSSPCRGGSDDRGLPECCRRDVDRRTDLQALFRRVPEGSSERFTNGVCLVVPNFPQPQPCWPLSTQGPHPSLLDGESPWWCCGISLPYAWRRHLVRTASDARMAQHAREAHRERGSLGAGRGPASLEETTALRIPTHHGHCAGSRPVVTKSLGPGGRADGCCANPLPSSPVLAIRIINSQESNPSRLKAWQR